MKMQHLLRGLERHGIGHRALGETDFYRICEELDIEIWWSNKRFPLFFSVPDDDLRIIILPKRLSGLQMLFAAYHELGHCLNDVGAEPCIAFLGGNDRREREADAVALVALFPSPRIEDAEYPIFCRFSRKLWDDRQRLFFLYGI